MAIQELPSFMTASTFVTTVNGVPSTGVTTMVVSSDLPTQALPPYLSASTLTTVVGGVPTVVVSTVEVPITYFGPSIPLGTDGVWTFGGSTSPASTSQLTSTSTATPPSSLTSTSSGATTTSSSVSESSSTSVILSTSSGSSAISTSTSSTSAGPVSTSSSVSKSSTLHRALPGIIIAAVVVAVAFIMLLCLWRYRRRRRALEYEHPNLSDFVIVDNEGHPRLAGEGVPRTTGEEEDSFLRRSGDATDGMQQADTSARLVTIPSRSGTVVSTGTTPLPEGVVPTALKSVSSKGSPTLPHGAASPFFHASASSLFFNPSRGPDQAVVGSAAVGGGKRDSASTRHSTSSASPVIGSIIPTRQLLQMEDDWRQEDAAATPIAARRGTTELGERVDEYGEIPLRPPPTLNPDRPVTPRPLSMFGTVGSHPESLGSEPDETVMLLTARRVMMNEGGPTTLVEAGNNNGNGSGPSSWGSSLAQGLGGLTRLSRLSWFQRMEAMRAHSPTSEVVGRSESRSATPGTSQRRPTSLAERAGLTVPRPISHLSVGSGKSSNGDTVFYDALSSVSTRSGHGHGHRPSSMPPLPRPHTATPTQPASAPDTPPAHDTSSGSQVHFDQPVAPSPIHPRSRDPTPPNAATAATLAPNMNEALDVLDTPVPSAVSPFSTASSRGGPAYPPGLEQHISDIRAWRESSSDMPSPASFGTGSASGRGGSFAVVGAGPDILEEEPPRPREGWTHLRTVTSGTVDTGRRTTLGQPILIDLNDDDLDLRHRSEQGSLHSMPDRLGPFSPAGSGSNSRAPSRHTFYGSSTYSSGSSRSPGHLTPREGSGSSSQLAHTNSVTSDGRRRPRREAGEPLSPSTPGSSAYGRARLSALGGPRSTVTSPQLSPAHDATFAPGITGAPSSSTVSDSAGGLSGASHTSRSTLVEPVTSDVLPHATVHWPASGEILPL